MNYPIWYLPETGGGLLVALIAVLHVYVSHFAVGGGLYLVLAEKKGLREKSQAILDFTRRHARFFVLVTLVFGSISGVGIWFIIGLVNPAATSFLIHNFVFAWAVEWVFFMVEIAAAFVFFYMFGRMDWKTHLRVGWLYFVAAWMSLLVINGIIGVMLTPGVWPENFDFWSGFFNPGFWPSLFFRTFVALLMAACYGYLTAAFTKDDVVRRQMTRFSAKFGMIALIAAIPAGLWYLAVLPEAAQGLVLGKSPTFAAILPLTAIGLLVLFIILLGAGIFRPANNLKPVAFVAMLCGLVLIGGFEWGREAARRPYVLNEVMYSNSIFKKDVDRLNRAGYLQAARWSTFKEVNSENLLEAGHELFVQQCYSCHTVNGWNNDIVSRTASMSKRGLVSYISKIHQVRYFMPPFVGTEQEIDALASYIAYTLHDKEPVEPDQQKSKAAAAGEILFEENCSACHDVAEIRDGLSGSSRTEIITVLGTLDEINTMMEPFPGTDEEAAGLAGFLMTPQPDEVSRDLSAQGKEVFAGYCAMCHNEVEEVTGMTAGMERQEIHSMLGKLDELNDMMPPFEGTEAERDALADYLYSLQQGEQ
ncbi:MAG: c-type cytochrome [Desulfopila sp.]